MIYFNIISFSSFISLGCIHKYISLIQLFNIKFQLFQLPFAIFLLSFQSNCINSIYMSDRLIFLIHCFPLLFQSLPQLIDLFLTHQKSSNKNDYFRILLFILLFCFAHMKILYHFIFAFNTVFNSS